MAESSLCNPAKSITVQEKYCTVLHELCTHRWVACRNNPVAQWLQLYGKIKCSDYIFIQIWFQITKNCIYKLLQWSGPLCATWEEYGLGGQDLLHFSENCKKKNCSWDNFICFGFPEKHNLKINVIFSSFDHSFLWPYSKGNPYSVLSYSQILHYPNYFFSSIYLQFSLCWFWTQISTSWAHSRAKMFTAAIQGSTVLPSWLGNAEVVSKTIPYTLHIRIANLAFSP